MPKALSALRENLRLWLPRMWRVTGREKTTGEHLSVLYAGPETQFHFLIDKIFEQDDIQRTSLGRHTAFGLDRVAQASDCSMSVLATSRGHLAWLGRPDDLYVPWWIDSRLSIAETLAQPKTKGLANDLRKLRKYQLEYQVAQTPGDCDFFYERIYYPTIHGAHEEASLPSCKRQRAAQVRRGQGVLVLVKHAGDVVGGALVDLRDRIPVLRDVGILDGDRRLLNLGVVTAANFFALQYLHQHGAKTASLGLSRCFLDDGVLQYKRKWKATFEHPSQTGFLFRIHEMTAASRGFLVANPSITEANGSLRRTRFIDPANPGSHQKLLELRGIPDIAAYDVSGQSPVSVQPAG